MDRNEGLVEGAQDRNEGRKWRGPPAPEGPDNFLGGSRRRGTLKPSEKVYSRRWLFGSSLKFILPHWTRGHKPPILTPEQDITQHLLYVHLKQQTECGV